MSNQEEEGLELRLFEVESRLVEAKLDLIRGEMRAGFDRLEGLIAKQDQMDKRLQSLEVAHAESKMKLQLIGIAMTLGSGSIGAFLGKLFE